MEMLDSLNYAPIDIKETYFLEYSPTQKNFHVDDLGEIMKHNRAICQERRKDLPGYIIIDGPFADMDSAFKAIKKFPGLMKESYERHRI